MLKEISEFEFLPEELIAESLNQFNPLDPKNSLTTNDHLVLEKNLCQFWRPDEFQFQLANV